MCLSLVSLIFYACRCAYLPTLLFSSILHHQELSLLEAVSPIKVKYFANPNQVRVKIILGWYFTFQKIRLPKSSPEFPNLRSNENFDYSLNQKAKFINIFSTCFPGRFIALLTTIQSSLRDDMFVLSSLSMKYSYKPRIASICEKTERKRRKSFTNFRFGS